MVAIDFDHGRRTATVVLRPNQSWTWRANRYLLYTLMTVSGAIAVGFTMNGLWLVLPFTALEMLALLACLAYCVRRAQRQEVLTMTVDDVRLQKGHDKPELEVSYPRFFAHFHVDTRHPWYGLRVALTSRGDEHEIGSFLSEAEKRELLRGLRNVLHQLERPV